MEHKIGIICATADEIELLRKDIRTDDVTVIAGREYISGELYGRKVILVMSRIGKVAAASTAVSLIDRFGADRVLFCGTAGGIGHGMKVGDIVIGDSCVQHDFFVPGGEDFRIPILNVCYFPSDEKLIEAAESAVKDCLDLTKPENILSDIPKEDLDAFGITAPKAAVGTVASGDQFICTSEKKEELLSRVKNIKCAEMEGAAVAQVCYEFGVPFLPLRVISDSADDSAGIDYDTFIAKVSNHFVRSVIRAILPRIA